MQPTQLGWTAFIVAIASVTATPTQAFNADAVQTQGETSNTIESRLARIQSTIKSTNAGLVDGQLPEGPFKNGDRLGQSGRRWWYFRQHWPGRLGQWPGRRRLWQYQPLAKWMGRSRRLLQPSLAQWRRLC